MSKGYTLRGLSTLHANVFSLFLTLCNKFHDVHINNIYINAKFAHLLYTIKNRVKVQGVCQTGDWGILREAFQTELHDKKSADQLQKVCTF